MNTAFIGLGSNIEPRADYLQLAVEKLSEHDDIHVIQTSSIYETEPVDFLDQSKFLNMVIEVSTLLKASDLLNVCQAIENELGRTRVIEKGPRTIDLDILLFNDVVIDEPKLNVPHPRMDKRAFVLIPLKEIAPKQKVPPHQKEVIELLEALPQKELDGVVFWRCFTSVI